MNSKLIATLIFLLPLTSVIKLGETDLWYSHYFFSSFFLFSFLAFRLWKLNVFLSLFAGWVVFNSYWVASHHPRSFLTLVQFMGGCYLAYAISFFNKPQRKNIVYALLGAFILQSIMMALQAFGVDPIFKDITNPGNDVVVGLSASMNQFGLYMADMGPVVLSVFPYFWPLAVIGTMLSKTTFAFAGLMVGSMFYLFKTYKTKFIIDKYQAAFLAILLAVVFFLKFDVPSRWVAEERMLVWKNSIMQVEAEKAEMTVFEKNNVSVTRYLTCSKWTGFGFGNFMRVSPYTQLSYLPQNYDNATLRSRGIHVYEHAHNDYVEVYFDLGRIGFLLMFLLVGSVFYFYITAKEKSIQLTAYFSALLAHLVTATGIYTVHTALSGMMLAVLYGLFMGEIKNNGKTPKLGTGRA